MTVPGLGGQQYPPYNAPAGQAPSPGIQPGTSSTVVRARTVIVSGPTGAVVGVFIYAAGTTPALGNPPIVAITNQTKDPYGNSVVPADSPLTSADFVVLGAAGSYLQLGVTGGLASAYFGTGDSQETFVGSTGALISGSGGTRQLETNVQSPAFATGNPAAIQLLCTSQDGTINSQINLQCLNRVVFGAAGNAWWADGTQQLNLPAAGGPFIFGEAFHTVSLAAGLSGRCRVKKVPWSGIWIDLEVSVSNANVSFTLGSLPDATYYPTVGIRLPIGFEGNSAALSIPTSGAISILLGGSANGFNLGMSTVYPTN